MQQLSFEVPGEPAPWGVYTRYDDSDSKARLKAYQNTVRIAARAAMQGLEPHRRRVHLEMHFYRGIRDSAPQRPDARERWIEEHIIKRPDLTNYQKAAEDSLSEEAVRGVKRELLGIVYVDDAQVTRMVTEKDYAEEPKTVFLVKLL